MRLENSPDHRDGPDGFNPLPISLPLLIFRCLDDGRKVSPSPQWLAFTGLGFEASLGQGWLNAIHPDDHGTVAAAWRIAAASRAYSVQTRVWSKAEGKYRWHLSRANPAGDDADESGIHWVGGMIDIHDLFERQSRQDVLISELNHRARNQLALTWALASKTIQNSESLQTFKSEFRQRIRALARVQELRPVTDHLDFDLRELVASQINALVVTGRDFPKITIEGPTVLLSSSSAQTLGLAVHELATNALKYGALSQSEAELQVIWEIETSGEPVVRFIWKESSVRLPPDAHPKRSGYGTELIKRALPYDLGAKTDLLFEPDGVRCIIVVDRKRLGDRRA
jgi:two-component sensor histidine kinase